MSNFFCECPDSGEPPCFGLVQLREQLAAAQSELERVRDKCNEHYMALAAAQEARQRAEMRLKLYEPIHTFNGMTIEQWMERAQRAEELLKQFFLNDSPWPDVESREEMQSFIDNMTTEEIGRWGKAHPHHLCAALLIRCKRAEALAESYKNPSAEAINASFHGMVETQDILGQSARRAEFKRRYLLVIAAIDAARGKP